tara:strand:- start:416 stop:721 length:306 start_codon:yes stop_codon:yes gene_type:complete
MKKTKEIKKQLLKDKIYFTVKGVTHYSKNENDEYGIIPKRFHTLGSDCNILNDGENHSIYDDNNKGMNIEKYGTKQLHLYGYDMLGNRFSNKIRYEDITII